MLERMFSIQLQEKGLEAAIFNVKCRKACIDSRLTWSIAKSDAVSGVRLFHVVTRQTYQQKHAPD